MITSDARSVPATIAKQLRGRMLMRIFVCLVAATFLSVVNISSVEARTQFKIATLLPENTDRVKRMRAAADEIEERTDGRVSFKYYFGGSQGSDDKVLYKMKIGQLHGTTFSPAALQKVYPDINIYGLPFIFESGDEVDYVRKRMDAKFQRGLEEAGFVNFGFAGGGFAMVLSNEPVRSHNDLKGQKVWVPEGDIFSYEAMQALKLTPVPLEIANVMTGLQTGLIDIVAIPPAGALIFQWHTKVNYVTQMPVLFTMYFMVIDARAFKRIEATDQAIVREVMGNLYAEFDAAERKDAPDALQALMNAGVESVEPLPDEFENLQEETAIANRSMADRGMFSTELLEEMLSHVQDFRRALPSHDTINCVLAGEENDAGEQETFATEADMSEADDMDVCEPDVNATEPLEQASGSES
jgi:TRAP-type C4-dicarboxylate transport system substrate-binding protein